MRTKIYESLSYLFPLWRETSLQAKGAEEQETKFIIQAFNKSPEKIKTVIDLGGGVGMHSNILAKKGYDVTLFDQSKKALRIAKKNNPKIKTVHGSFESIDLTQKFDAAICMWSTLSYIFMEKGRNTFYEWQSKHIKHLIILDQANFYKYDSTFYKMYEGENKDYKLIIHRNWALNKKHLKKTKFIYWLYNKHTKRTEVIKDSENEQYVPVKNLKKYLGKTWQLKYLLGDYELDKKYEKKSSPRIITVFYNRCFSQSS